MAVTSRSISRQRWRAVSIEGIAVVVVVCVCLLALQITPVVRMIENWLWDLRVMSITAPRSSESGNPEIVVVAITEESLSRFPYRSPVDRAWLARLLHSIAVAQPAAIGVDILFDQPTEPEKDNELQRTLSGMTVPVVVATADGDGQLTAAQTTFLDRFLPASSRVRPAWANMMTDRDDGTVRQIFAGKNSLAGWRSGMVPALAEAVGRVTVNVPLPFALNPFTDSQPLGVPVYPADAVSVLPPSWLAGKVVLVGFDLPMSDRHRSSAASLYGVRGGTLPGVVLHAHALNHLLSGGVLVAPTMGWQILALALMALAGAGAARLDFPLGGRMVGIVIILALYWAIAIQLFAGQGLILPMFMPSIAFILSAGAVSTHLWQQAKQQRAFIENAFERYVSPSIVRELTQAPDRLVLGGEMREITYVFTDVAGFTSLAEGLEPQQLCQVLNEYLDGMCRLFFHYEATIDKIVGDAVVGFFNAPVDQPDHAERAVKLALAVDQYAESFRVRMEAVGYAMGETRVGVHSGSAVVGNFGGDHFFNYTGHGDTVNTAARLEGANKYFGTRLCVSQATASLCPDQVFRPIGEIRLKGKRKSLLALEPASVEFARSDHFGRYLEAYEALSADREKAGMLFARICADFPEDGLARFHNQRISGGSHGNLIELAEK
ncbi:Putative adenylate/guanylate cyclase [Magnetospirillum gryphiswaldense MSR-1 v2]|uniref:Adenylate/guanylate cyclase n=1 Tax=Magnetospirillum gryphiswaldense (strain DSM 6361 / JCM 21280 / NBRC 15271 / MSR-1) TaxID=431944 RepID=V6F8W0_MAGGM|nr:Putative adenylate/guanylate cyclase [Magnetospirillum gryphiswaldense MSR-1 v2]